MIEARFWSKSHALRLFTFTNLGQIAWVPRNWRKRVDYGKQVRLLSRRTRSAFQSGPSRCLISRHDKINRRDLTDSLNLNLTLNLRETISGNGLFCEVERAFSSQTGNATSFAPFFPLLGEKIRIAITELVPLSLSPSLSLCRGFG